MNVVVSVANYLSVNDPVWEKQHAVNMNVLISLHCRSSLEQLTKLMI